MPDPEAVGRILENCTFSFRHVVCRNKDKVASITAAKVQMEANDWSVGRLLLAAERRGQVCDDVPVARI